MGSTRVLRKLFAFTLMSCSGWLGAQPSIHTSPLGTPARGSFFLVGKTVPLPEGEFILAATKIRDSTYVSGDWLRPQHKMVDVFLVQIEGRKLRSAVVAYTVLQWATHSTWEMEPCKRTDTLLRVDLAGDRPNSANCLIVNHLVNSMGSSATGIYADAVAWLAKQGVNLPINTILDVQITNVQLGTQVLMVRYAFNPEAFNCDSPASPSWQASPWHKNAINSDPERLRFANSVMNWGKGVQAYLTQPKPRGEGKQFVVSDLYRCGTQGTARSESNVEEPRSRTPAQGAIAERLRTLEDLREKKLISPIEYEERRRAILNSL